MVIGDVSAPPKERGASAAEPLAAVAPVDSADPAETAPTDERAPAPEGPPRPGVLVIVLAVVLFVSVVVAFLGVFAVTAAYGIAAIGLTPAVVNNLAFAMLYAVVMLVGIWPALVGDPAVAVAPPEEDVDEVDELGGPDIVTPALESV